MPALTRRHLLISTAATAAVAAMPAGDAIAAAETAPFDPSYRGFSATPFALDDVDRAGFPLHPSSKIWRLSVEDFEEMMKPRPRGPDDYELDDLDDDGRRIR